MATPLTQNTKIFTYALSVTTTTVQNSTVFDMTGFESITAIAGRSASNAESTGGLKFSVGTASGSLSQTSGIVTHGNASGAALEMFRPNYRYVRADFLTTVTTTGPLVNPFMVVVLSGAKELPVSQTTDILESKIVYTPGTGTATG